MKFTYLLIDLLSVLIPVIFSFHPRVEFYKTRKAYLPAIFFAGLFFLIGDSIYAGWGVWGFNEKYLVGLNFFHLPLEEYLFFFCIPFACLFSYHVFDRLVDLGRMEVLSKVLSLPIIILSVVVSVLYFDRAYTLASAGGLALLVFFVRYVYKATWLGKFYFIYLILMIPFMIVNGLLTGTGLAEPVVWYNDSENMGIRMLTIPFEDVFYGMTLILLNVLGFEYLKAHFKIEVPKPS